MRSAVAVTSEMAVKLFMKLEADSPLGSTRAANLIQNQPLNRWNNVLPYDSTRVKLENTAGAGGSRDYINASRVVAPYLDNKSYILTQGPLPETIHDFWTMVYQQNVDAIVMLCRLTETGICKCAHYWPLDSTDVLQNSDPASVPTAASDDLIQIKDHGLEVRLRDYDDSDKDFVVSKKHTISRSGSNFSELTRMASFFPIVPRIAQQQRF